MNGREIANRSRVLEPSRKFHRDPLLAPRRRQRGGRSALRVSRISQLPTAFRWRYKNQSRFCSRVRTRVQSLNSLVTSGCNIEPLNSRRTLAPPRSRPPRTRILAAVAATALLGCGASAVTAPASPASTKGSGPDVAQTPTTHSSPLPARRGSKTGKTAPLPWLNSRTVASAVRPHRTAFNSCHRLAANSLTDATGEVTVGWLVHPSGDIHEAKVNRSTFAMPEVGECVLAVARQVEFPPSRATSEISWTVRFRGELPHRMATAAR